MIMSTSSYTIQPCSRGKIRALAHSLSSAADTTYSAQNSLGVHALVYVGGWTRADAEAAITSAQRCGYSFIEIPLLDPTTVDAGMTKSILDAHGMRATASLGLHLDADISSADPECAARGEALLMSALNAASGFGSQYMCGILYSALAKYAHPPSLEGRAHCVAALKRVAKAAADRGVTLGLEVVNRYETNLVNTALQAMELLADVNEANVVVHLDSYHMHIEEASMAAAVYACGDKLGYLHIGESHRGYLGSGSVDFTELFRALEELEYTGPIAFESFSSRVVSPSLSNTLGIWRYLWDGSDDLAIHARQYITSELVSAQRFVHLALGG